MGEGLMGWFEFLVVTACFFSRAYGRNIDFWKAIQSPMDAEDLVKIAARSFGWISILCVYLIFRVQFLTISAMIGFVVVFLGLFMFFLALSAIASLLVYSGIWEDWRERFFLWVDIRSHEFADQLRVVRARYRKF
jgi:hypothetical protein